MNNAGSESRLSFGEGGQSRKFQFKLRYLAQYAVRESMRQDLWEISVERQVSVDYDVSTHWVVSEFSAVSCVRFLYTTKSVFLRLAVVTMSSKSISTGTLSLRFMQNAHRAKQLKEVEPDRAEVKDDGMWEVSQAVRDAWGLPRYSDSSLVLIL